MSERNRFLDGAITAVFVLAVFGVIAAYLVDISAITKCETVGAVLNAGGYQDAWQTLTTQRVCVGVSR